MVNIENKIIRAYALKNALEHNGKAVVGSVISGLFNHGLTKDGIKDIMPLVQAVLREVNAISISEQEKEFDLLKDFVGHRPEREGLPELDNVDGKKGVVMRYRPGPSGPLHIGHIISNLLNSLYVEKYSGKFYVIIDDTDPKTSLKESYGNIRRDCDWIFGNVYEYINASDRMELYYKYINELLKKDVAYICTCSSENFKKLIDNKKACVCRKLDVKDNLKRWDKMLDNKGYNEGEAVVRFKSDIKDSNPAMRDFPLARIDLHEHPIQKNKYRVWPLMNLSVSVDDMELKMTHIIRGKDHMDNAKRQKMIFDVFKKPFPETYFIGRIKFTDLVLSKRKISQSIKEGVFSGEEDEKLPTIASLRKRGYKREAFVKFVEQRGITEVDKVISGKDLFDVLDRFNQE
jgi:glutamyl-tRNA synthetase